MVWLLPPAFFTVLFEQGFHQPIRSGTLLVMNRILSRLLALSLTAGSISGVSAQTQSVTYEEYIRNAYASTRYILQATCDFAAQNNKKQMVILFDPYGATKQLLQGEPRVDQSVVDYLDDNGYNYFDMNLVHVADYKNFNLSVGEYYNRYFIGHYNPSGNHFFAYSIKPKVVQWLDPKPFTYQVKGNRSIGFEGYLQGVYRTTTPDSTTK